MQAGSVLSDDTAVVCLGLPSGEARDRALDHLERISGANDIDGPGSPPYGWPWTDGAHGWIEPTSWGILALRAGRPDATDRIDDGLGVLRAQECEEGGWNYGTRVGFGVVQRPFVQTTSIGALAARGLDDDLSRRGIAVLEARWQSEAAGLLSVATAATVLSVVGSPAAVKAGRAADAIADRTQDADTVALAWAVLALSGRDPSTGIP